MIMYPLVNHGISSEEGPMGFNGIYMGYLRNDGRNYTTFMGNNNYGTYLWDNHGIMNHMD